jgi:Ala-tRNA(Pro) deacylase
LAQLVGVSKLSLASSERLAEYLQIDPGSVSILALVNDREHRVELLVEREVWQSAALQAHPLVNTVTLVIPKSGLERFLAQTGHMPRVIESDNYSTQA